MDGNEAERDRISSETLRRMREFTAKLKAGIPVEGWWIQRVETPDGPMHVRRPYVITPNESK